MKSKILLIHFMCFLIFTLNLFCKNETNQKISTYILSTYEVSEFCNAIIPCIKEEVSNTFKDLPQQREYLLSKTNLQNCVLEQSTKLDELLKLSKVQISTFYQEINSKSKSHQSFNYHMHPTLKNLFMFVHQEQKLILEAFIQCKDNIIKSNDCSIKKNIIKSSEYCLKIFSYKTNTTK